jgi:hypothetical protein
VSDKIKDYLGVDSSLPRRTSSRKPEDIDDSVEIAAYLAECFVADQAVSRLLLASKFPDIPTRHIRKTIFHVSPHHVLLI